ncbi:LCP family protein [Streptomyces sp. NPDC002221]|uniref:LCP family protein n=1 Tax=Streptomyces sp. NPDC002221 TaxID=3364639 RepID=UPI0036B0C48A
MDADVTDSAGTPPEPEEPAGAEQPPPADGAATGQTEAAGEPGPADVTGGTSGTSESGESGESTERAERTERTENAGTSTADGTGAPGEDAGSPAADAKGRRHWLRWTALGVSVVVLAAAGTGWWFYRKLDGNIQTDTTAAHELDKYEHDRPAAVVHDAQNLLLIGSDSRAGNNSAYGRDDGGSQRSDTTILLHLAADRRSATAVSLPRDLMADIPACGRPDGGSTKAQFAQFNSAFEIGGAACTIRTVEKMTGVRIDHHIVVDFNGFKDMVDAVDGVEVCLKDPVDDRQAHLKLPAGRQTLHGEQALGFVRSRHGFGDGSDTQRMDRQQQFLGSLMKKVQSNGVLLNPARLYPVLDAATKSLTTDPGLNTLGDLYDLVRSMRDIPTENIRFLTVPRQPYAYDGNRDELVQPDADRLFKQVRDDQPIKVAAATDVEKAKEKAKEGTKKGDGQGDKPDDPDPSSSPSAPPVYSGTDAASGMCG